MRFKAVPLFTTNCTIPEVHFNKAMIKLQQLDRASYRKQIVTPIFWTNRIRTAATCGVFTYFNPEWYVDYCDNVHQRVFTHAHEIKHIWLRHPQRGKVFRLRDYFVKGVPFIHRIYNTAADVVINADNVALGMEAPKGVLFDPRFGRNDNVDAVYMTLIKEYLAKQEEEKCLPPPPADDSDDEESGDDAPETDDSADDTSEAEDDESGDDSTEGESEDESEDESEGEPQPSESDDFDDHFEPQYDGTPEEQAEDEAEDEARIERDVDDAIDDAENDGMPPMGKGFTQAGYRHCDPCNPSNVNWKERLADSLTKPGAGGDANWGKINRRKLMTSGVVTPTRKGSLNRLIITSDISGSINTEQRDKFHTEFGQLADILQPLNGTMILWTNTEVVKVDVAMSGAELMALEHPLSGGNYLSSSLTWLHENGITDGDVHLVFTDGWTPLEDYQRFAEAGAIIVLDSMPNTYVMDLIDQVGIDYIVMV